MFYSVAAGRPINQSTVYLRFRGYLADAGIPHFTGGPHPHSLRHGFAVANLRRWAEQGADLAVMLPYLACYMGHADLRGTQYYLRLTADAYPEVMARAQVRFGYVIPPRPGTSREPAARAAAGPCRALGVEFFTNYLAGERAASPKTVSSYRDAMKLLLTWFRDAERIPPEKLRLADIDRPRILRFLDWLEDERGCSPATRNQRLAVIKSFCRYTAVEQPDHLDQVTQVLAIRQKKTPAPQLDHLAGDEVRTLLAEPGTASARAVRDTVLLALAYDTAARVQELCDLDVADIRRGSPMTVVIRGKGSKIRYVPVMAPTARLAGGYLDHRDRHPGVGADADPLFAGPNHSRLTGSGVAKLLARYLRAVRARDPGWAPGLPITPHTLRRSRAMHLVQAASTLSTSATCSATPTCPPPRSTPAQTPRPNAERSRTPTSRSPPTPCRTGPWTRPCSAGSTRSGADASPGGLCGLQHQPRCPEQRKHHDRAHNPAVRLMPDFVNGEEHLLLASRQGAGAFQVLACSGGIHAAKQDFAAAARLPALPGCARDSDVCRYLRPLCHAPQYLCWHRRYGARASRRTWRSVSRKAKASSASAPPSPSSLTGTVFRRGGTERRAVRHIGLRATGSPAHRLRRPARRGGRRAPLPRQVGDQREVSGEAGAAFGKLLAKLTAENSLDATAFGSSNGFTVTVSTGSTVGTRRRFFIAADVAVRTSADRWLTASFSPRQRGPVLESTYQLSAP